MKLDIDYYLDHGINAFVPTDDNCTRVHLKDSIIVDVDKKVDYVINKTALYFQTSLSIIHKKYSSMLKKRNFIPVPLRPGLVLVPFKTRHTNIKDNGCFGYFSLNEIKHIDPDNKSSVIVFKNNLRILVLESEICCRKRISDAVFVESQFVHCFTQNNILSLCPINV